MDLESLMYIRSHSCKTAVERLQFDNLFQTYYQEDPNLEIRNVFDVIASRGDLPTLALDIIYSQMFSSEIHRSDGLDSEVCALAACVLSTNFRGPAVERQRLNWDMHVKTLLREGGFREFYRMSNNSFCKLLQHLSASLTVKKQQGNSVVPEIIMHCTLRYLAGGSFSEVPTPNDTPNVSSYFSGHYQCHGLNVQASCDARCRFTWISIRSPGGTGDSKAFYGTSLDLFLQTMPQGFYIVADNAYTISNSLLIPYSGDDKRRPKNDVFNFYLSKVRIKIEQAFGMLVNKWRVFKRPLEMKLSRIPHLVECAFRMHNFCINQQEPNWKSVSIPDVLLQSHVPAYEEYLDALDSENSLNERTGRGAVRRAIREQLCSHGRSRPVHNLKRNRST